MPEVATRSDFLYLFGKIVFLPRKSQANIREMSGKLSDVLFCQTVFDSFH